MWCMPVIPVQRGGDGEGALLPLPLSSEFHNDTMHAYCPWRSKEASDPLELVFKMVVSRCVVLETEPGSSSKAAASAKPFLQLP